MNKIQFSINLLLIYYEDQAVYRLKTGAFDYSFINRAFTCFTPDFKWTAIRFIVK